MTEDYRLGVGIILLNPQKQIFLGQRIDKKTGDHAWQMPQGGIDAGEDPQGAVFRELGEETGTVKARIIAESKDWLQYDLPAEYIPKFWNGRFRGQRQKWFVLEFLGLDEDINLQTPEPEFQDWMWATQAQTMERVVAFKHDLYTQVFAEFKDLL